MIFLIWPISVAAFFIKIGKNAYTAFYTLIFCPASNNYLINFRIFLTNNVFPVDNKSNIIELNLSIISGMYYGWYLFIFLNYVIHWKLYVQLCPLMYVYIKFPLFDKSYIGTSCSKLIYCTSLHCCCCCYIANINKINLNLYLY